MPRSKRKAGSEEYESPRHAQLAARLPALYPQLAKNYRDNTPGPSPNNTHFRLFQALPLTLLPSILSYLSVNELIISIVQCDRRFHRLMFDVSTLVDAPSDQMIKHDATENHNIPSPFRQCSFILCPSLISLLFSDSPPFNLYTWFTRFVPQVRFFELPYFVLYLVHRHRAKINNAQYASLISCLEPCHPHFVTFNPEEQDQILPTIKLCIGWHMTLHSLSLRNRYLARDASPDDLYQLYAVTFPVLCKLHLDNFNLSAGQIRRCCQSHNWPQLTDLNLDDCGFVDDDVLGTSDSTWLQSSPCFSPVLKYARLPSRTPASLLTDMLEDKSSDVSTFGSQSGVSLQRLECRFVFSTSSLTALLLKLPTLTTLDLSGSIFECSYWLGHAVQVLEPSPNVVRHLYRLRLDESCFKNEELCTGAVYHREHIAAQQSAVQHAVAVHHICPTADDDDDQAVTNPAREARQFIASSFNTVSFATLMQYLCSSLTEFSFEFHMTCQWNEHISRALLGLAPTLQKLELSCFFEMYEHTCLLPSDDLLADVWRAHGNTFSMLRSLHLSLFPFGAESLDVMLSYMPSLRSVIFSYSYFLQAPRDPLVTFLLIGHHCRYVESVLLNVDRGGDFVSYENWTSCMQTHAHLFDMDQLEPFGAEPSVPTDSHGSNRKYSGTSRSAFKLRNESHMFRHLTKLQLTLASARNSPPLDTLGFQHLFLSVLHHARQLDRFDCSCALSDMQVLALGDFLHLRTLSVYSLPTNAAEDMYRSPFNHAVDDIGYTLDGTFRSFIDQRGRDGRTAFFNDLSVLQTINARRGEAS